MTTDEKRKDDSKTDSNISCGPPHVFRSIIIKSSAMETFATINVNCFFFRKSSLFGNKDNNFSKFSFLFRV